MGGGGVRVGEEPEPCAGRGGEQRTWEGAGKNSSGSGRGRGGGAVGRGRSERGERVMGGERGGGGDDWEGEGDGGRVGESGGK